MALCQTRMMNYVLSLTSPIPSIPQNSTSNPTPSHCHTLRRETLLLPKEQKEERANSCLEMAAILEEPHTTWGTWSLWRLAACSQLPEETALPSTMPKASRDNRLVNLSSRVLQESLNSLVTIKKRNGIGIKKRMKFCHLQQHAWTRRVSCLVK